MIWSEIGPESKDFKEKRSKWNAVVDSSHRMWLFVEQSFIRVRSPQKKLYRCCSIDLWIKWSKIKCVWSSRSAIVVDSSWCCAVEIITVKQRVVFFRAHQMRASRLVQVYVISTWMFLKCSWKRSERVRIRVFVFFPIDKRFVVSIFV